MHQNLFLNAIRLKKCVVKFSIPILLQYECVIKLLIKVFLRFSYVPDRYKTQEMYNRIISDDPFSIRYVSDQYKT